MFIVYDIIFVLFAVLYFPYMIIRGKWHSGFKMRFGNLSSSFIDKLSGKPRIWIHAVSVGEVLAVIDLIGKMKSQFPQYDMVCSTVTTTGYQLAEEKLGKDCAIIYAPLDFSRIVRKFIAIIDPKIYISTETEIWPNLYTALHERGVPIMQINGRISDKAFKGYQKVRFLTKRVLACVKIFCMQSPLDAERVERMGAAPEKVHVVGNLKFDNMPASVEVSKKDLGFKEDESLLIAGSTHPGEEEILMDVYQKLAKKFSHVRLVIAPRHIERVNAITGLIQKKGYKPVRFSEIQSSDEDDKSIIVVDTIGHLRTLYNLATIVFIGKTLTVGGGQNMIESACFGKPTIVGPLTQNFKDVVSIFLNSEALVQVNNSEELLEEIDDLLTNSQRAKEIGEAAKKIVEKHKGATEKTLKAISELLNCYSG